MRRALAIVGLFAVVPLVRMTGDHLRIETAPDSTLVLGFILFAGYLAGEGVRRLGLPRITGYILAGVACGPYLLPAISPRLELVSRPAVEGLIFIDRIALGLIAFSAGGELEIAKVRRALAGVAWVTVLNVVIVLLGMTGILLLVAGQTDLLGGLDGRATLAVALLLGTVAIATSPAVTIAVINEFQPRGTMTDLMLGVTVVKDMAVVVVFACALPIALLLLVPGSTLDLGFLLLQLWDIGGSVGVGLLLGWLLGLYIGKVGRELGLVVVTIGFLAIFLADHAHLSGLIICMTAGFYVENFARQGRELIAAVERHSLPVYLVFFTIAGASVELAALSATWKLALVLVGARALLFAISITMACKVAGYEQRVVRNAWLGFLSQAGLALSFARRMQGELPDPLGAQLFTLLVAVVAIHEIVGPVCARIGLQRAGEIPDSPGRAA